MASNSNYAGCTYLIGVAFFAEYGIDVAAYTGEDPDDISDTATFPYRYDTEKFYGFCVPSFDAESGGVSALSDSAIETF